MGSTTAQIEIEREVFMQEKGRTVTPQPIPSDSVIREWEHYQRNKIHVRPLTDGQLGWCWCGEQHGFGEGREMLTTTQRKY